MTQETVRGLIMMAWALSIADHPHLRGLPLFKGLARFVSWLGNPSVIWSVSGLTIGAVVILAAELGERHGAIAASWTRRAMAIISSGYWLLVASGFAEISPTLPGVMIYCGMAALHGRTALGRTPR